MPKFISRKKIPEKRVQSYWPKGTLRLFETLREIPWVSLTAISTLCGVLILFLYFRSIEHFPSDFSSLISLGAAAAACALAVLVFLSLTLFAPAAIYSHYAGDDSSLGHRVSFSESQLVLLQLGGIGGLFAWMAYPYYRDCDRIHIWYSGIGAALGLLGLIALAQILSPAGSLGNRVARFWAACSVMFFGLAPAFIVIPLGQIVASSGFSFDVLFFTLWLLAILANAATGNKLRLVGVAVTAIFLVALLYLAVPLAIGKTDFFPQMVAKELGIRKETTTRIWVSRKNCELVKRSQQNPDKNNSLPCLDSDWNELKVQVLSNVGDRWLLELEVEQGAERKASGLRFTLPRNEIQIASRIPDAEVRDKPASCEKLD